MRLTLLSLSAQLRALREQSKMTQTQLAKEAGVSREWLNAVENGKVNVEFGLLLDVFSTLGYSLDVVRDENPKHLRLMSAAMLKREQDND